MRLTSHRWAGCGAPEVRRVGGFTLVEYLICFFIATFTITTIATGYLMASQRTVFQTASAAAQRVVDDRLEQVRGAQWDLYSNPPVPGPAAGVIGPQAVALELLQAGASDAIPAELYTTITDLSTNPPLKQVTVECVWSYRNRGPFTDVVVSYMAPRT